MTENRSRYAILGALTVAPMSGYDIRLFFDQSVSYFWTENFGQIYPMLNSLHRERLVKPSGKGGSSRRTVYEITGRGRRVLVSWLAEPANPAPRRNEILLKLFFAHEAPPTTAANLLAEFREQQENLLDRYAMIADKITVDHKGDPNLPNWLVTLSYGLRVSRTLLDWCDEASSVLGTAYPQRKFTRDRIKS